MYRRGPASVPAFHQRLPGLCPVPRRQAQHPLRRARPGHDRLTLVGHKEPDEALVGTASRARAGAARASRQSNQTGAGTVDGSETEDVEESCSTSTPALLRQYPHLTDHKEMATMRDEPGPPASSAPRATRKRRFKPRELPTPEGGRLVLHVDGVISQLDTTGGTEHVWAPEDPEWARHAIRFGLRVQVSTIPPTGRRVDATRPPRR